MRSILFILFALLSFPAMAQHFVWGKSFITNRHSISPATAVSVGKDKDVFLAGYYFGELNVEGQIFTSGASQHDGFLMKLDSSGAILWTKRLGTSGAGAINFMRTDNKGNITIGGYIYGSLQVLNETVVCEEGCSFVGKLNKEGEFLWITTMEEVNLVAMTLDAQGNLVGLTYPLSEPFVIKIFKFDGMGKKLLDVPLFEDTDSGYLDAFIIEPDLFGNFFISGRAVGPTMIGAILYNAPANGASVIIKCNASGMVKWIKHVDDNPGSSSIPGDMVVDGGGNVYHSAYGDRLLFSKYDSAGNVVWTKRNDDIHIHLRCLKLDALGNIYTAGHFRGSFMLEGISFTGPEQNMFVARFDNSGNLLWKIQGAGEQLDYVFDFDRNPKTPDFYFSGLLQSNTPSFGNVHLNGEAGRPIPFILKVSEQYFIPTPILNLGVDKNLCSGDIRLNVSGFYRYEWQDGSVQSYFDVIEPGEYYVKAVDYLGDTYADTVVVTTCPENPEEPEIPIGKIPNVITPDGNEFNEYFVIENLNLTINHSLFVYDRWGKNVYSTTAYQNNWNGEGLTGGVYYYQLIIGNDKRVYKGWVHIMK